MTGWLHFLNLQYWYCIIYSTFGGHCAYLDELRAEQGASGPGFFERLAQQFLAFYNAIVHGTSPAINAIIDTLAWLWHAYSALAYTVSGFLFFSILSAILGLAFIRFREMGMYGTLPPVVEEANPVKSRWQELLDDALSTDPKRWKSAILEADTMLGDLLVKLDYTGLNTGERMQRLSDDAFRTVPQAWEAHRVKNFVSSGSSNFILTQRDAYRVMKLYEQVFEEHHLI